MNFIAFLKQAKNEVVHGKLLPSPNAEPILGGSGLKGFAGDKLERYAATFAFGAAKGYYGSRYEIRGQSPDLVVGGVLTALSALATMFGYERPALHLGRIGDAGMGSHIHTWAVGWGAAQSGRPAPGKQPQLKGAVDEVLGAMPPAVGDWLTKDDVLNYKAPR